MRLLPAIFSAALMMTNPIPHLAKRLACLTAALVLLDCGLTAERKTENLILVTLDGVRSVSYTHLTLPTTPYV